MKRGSSHREEGWGRGPRGPGRQGLRVKRWGVEGFRIGTFDRFGRGGSEYSTCFSILVLYIIPFPDSYCSTILPYHSLLTKVSTCCSMHHSHASQLQSSQPSRSAVQVSIVAMFNGIPCRHAVMFVPGSARCCCASRAFALWEPAGRNVVWH